MIQFNLLPDIKLDYIKAERTKKMVILIALAATGAALAILVLLVLQVYVVQKAQMSSVDKSIKTSSDTLKNTKDVDKILTVQNQLNALGNLHQKKPQISRLFGFLSQLTPSQVKISNLKLDNTAATINLSGTADNQPTINKFIDTLKFTTYKFDGSTTTSKAFSNVVQQSYAPSDKGPTFTLQFSYDPTIFDITKKNLALSIPNTYTTRSITEQPDNSLFNSSQSNVDTSEEHQ